MKLAENIEESIEKAIPEPAMRLLNILEQAGYESYVVGGCVRDVLVGIVPHDWDITTAATPEQVKACLKAAGIDCIETGIAHGTVSAIFDKSPYEITTFRAESTYSDGRHPDGVTFIKDVGADLQRRDFTMNAIAYSPKRGLVDIAGGQKDLSDNLLRSVGVAHERFSEDALRILRALRFAATYGFEIESSMQKALHADKDLLKQVAAERIQTEMRRLICGKYMVDILLDYADIFAVCMPEISPCIGFDQQNSHHIYNVWEHMVRSAGFAPKDVVLRYAMLFHDIGKPACFFLGEDGQGHFYDHREVGADIFEKMARDMRMPQKEAKHIELLIRYHDANLPTTKKGLRRWILQFGQETVREILTVHRCDISALNPKEVPEALANMDKYQAFFEEVLSSMNVFGMKDLAINGHDLTKAGIEPGPELGVRLEACLQAVCDGEPENNHDELLEFALSYNSASASNIGEQNMGERPVHLDE